MKMSDNPAKYEVLIEQYLRSGLDISAVLWSCARHLTLTVHLSTQVYTWLVAILMPSLYSLPQA